MEFSRPFLNRLILRRHPIFHERLEAFKRGERKVSATDRHGNSLLHLAILENQLGHFKDLLSHGMLLKLKNKWGMSPLDLAHLLGRREFLPLLKKKGRPPPITIFRNSDQKWHSIPLEEFEKKLGIQYIDYLEFKHPDHLNWASWKSQRRLRKIKYRKMNRWVLALHQKGIQNPRHDHIYIRYIDGFLGYGVFANRDLPALTYVGEYTGVVSRRQSRKTRLNNYIFGYMTGPKNSPFVIDAKEKGNFTRFINHSDEPNLSSRWVVSGGITHIIVFANQPIPKGKQLTYDYGEHYWRSRSNPRQIT